MVVSSLKEQLYIKVEHSYWGTQLAKGCLPLGPCKKRKRQTKFVDEVMVSDRGIREERNKAEVAKLRYIYMYDITGKEWRGTALYSDVNYSLQSLHREFWHLTVWAYLDNNFFLITFFTWFWEILTGIIWLHLFQTIGNLYSGNLLAKTESHHWICRRDDCLVIRFVWISRLWI